MPVDEADARSEQSGERRSESRLRSAAARVLEALAGIVLLAAGLIKGYEPHNFAQQIADYKIVAAPALTALLAWLFIAAECALGAALIAGVKRRLALPAAAGLFAVFLLALAWAWKSGATADCGCFGSWSQRTPGQAFVEDLLILAAIVAAWFLSRKEPSGFRLVRWTIVAASLIVGVTLAAFASVSPRQSADPVVRLRAQSHEPTPFDTLKVEGISIDFAKGSHVIALIDAFCEHCQEGVPALNELASQTQKEAPLAAICANDPEVIAAFSEKYGARFPIGHISIDGMLRLLEAGSTPRIFLLRDASVVKIWDAQIPSNSEIHSLLSR